MRFPAYRNNITFWKNDVEVQAPWESDAHDWRNVDENDPENSIVQRLAPQPQAQVQAQVQAQPQTRVCPL